MIDTNSNDARSARERFPRYYDQLRMIAGRFLARERPGHTLQPTALVHEAFVRMCRVANADSFSENDWVRAAATNMRQILVEHARKKNAVKRTRPASLRIEGSVDDSEKSIDLIALDEALKKLEIVDPDLVQLIELRCFAGLTEDQVADMRGVSANTVRRDWRLAKRWLFCAIEPAE